MGAAAVIPHGCYGICSLPDGGQCAENADCVGESCLCREGFEGDGSSSCPDVDECITSIDDCDTNAACDNTVGSFTCACNNGFSGNGVTCDDINECADPSTNICHANATCGNIAGSFTCSCDEGYIGNGITCNDIDECIMDAHNCALQATCANADGSFTCACNTGYVGTGLICADEDECASGAHNCDAGAGYACENRVGSFECTCTPGGACEQQPIQPTPSNDLSSSAAVLRAHLASLAGLGVAWACLRQIIT